MPPAEVAAAPPEPAALLAALPDGVLVVDRDHVVRFVNRPSLAAAVVGRPVWDFVPKEHQDGLREALGRVFATGVTERLEVPGIHPLTGQMLWSHSSVAPVRGPGGEVEAAVVLASDLGTRRAAEEALAASEARWRSLVEHAPDTIVLLDPDDRITFVSRSGLHADAAEAARHVAGRRLTEFFEDDALRARVEGTLARARETGQPQTYEVPGLAHAGEPHWYRCRVGCLAAPYAPGSLLVIATDITDRRAAEEALRSSEARWRSLVEQSPDLVALLDRDLRVLFQNRVAHGWQLDEIVGKTLAELRGAEWEGERAEFEEALRTGRPGNFEGPMTMQDGSVRWYQRRIVPLLREGQVDGLLVLATDLTRRRHAEEALRRQALTFATIHDAVVHTDAEGRITEWNPAAERTFGYTGAEVAGRRPAFFRGADGGHGLAREMAEVAAREGRWHGELTAVRGDGTEVRCESVVVPLRDEAGKVTGYVGVHRDITERKRAELERLASLERLRELERLRDVDRFKTQFINMAAHELGTPLTPIKLQLHLLKTTPPGPKQDRALAILERNVQRLEQLVRDLLEVARLQSGKVSVRRDALDLGEVLQEAAGSFREVMAEGGVRLEIQVRGPLPVLGDASRLTQVVFNLLSNALKFSRPGTRVRLTAEARDGHAVVRVQDEGLGIAPADLGKLFQPFTQVHDQGALNPGGTGLGLFISRGIMELHGGDIVAESAGLGLGATFTFRVPLRGPSS